jgi:hypothetical protein
MEVKKMKKFLLLLLALALILGTSGIAVAAVTEPGVAGTPHDVRVMTGEDGLEPCAMCHTPHSGTGDYPLWNRDQGPQTYQMYNSPSFDMGTQIATGPGTPSSLCLICHNGVFSTLVNYPGPGSPANESYDYEMNPTFWAMLDVDLTNDHPISFTYLPSLDETQDGNGFPGIEQCNTAIGVRDWLPSYAEGGATGNGRLWYPLYSNANGTDQFECATCHSVHDTVSYYGKQMAGGKSVGTQVFFLRHSNAGSAMCGDCHINRLLGTSGFTRTGNGRISVPAE